MSEGEKNMHFGIPMRQKIKCFEIYVLIDKQNLRPVLNGFDSQSRRVDCVIGIGQSGASLETILSRLNAVRSSVNGGRLP